MYSSEDDDKVLTLRHLLEYIDIQGCRTRRSPANWHIGHSIKDFVETAMSLRASTRPDTIAQ
jgi:hypothetical protein